MPTINRRNLLGAAALSLAGTTLSASAARAKSGTPRRLRHVLSNESYSLRDEFRAGRLTMLNLAEFHKNTLGIRGISLNDMYFKSWDEGYLRQIMDSFKANDRVITCLIMEGNLASPSADERRKQIDSNTEKLKAAGFLGAPVVRMNLGRVGPGEDDRKEGVERCIAAFKEMLPLAQDLGIRITIENHGGVSGSIEGILAVIQGTDPKWVGSLLDFGNPPVGHNPELVARLAPYAYHTHAKLSRFKPDGEAENGDYGAILAILKKAKYEGAVSVEWEGEGEPIDGIKRTRDLIHKHWPELPV
jgi:L-ribulose-5-phosphate 3-epimerase